MTHLTRDTLVKILSPNRLPLHGGSGQWPEPGEWHSVTLPLVPCRHGLHVCTVAQSLDWPGPEMWLVEVDGERIAEPDKLVVERARLVGRIETWNERTARLFACDCAEQVLPLYERDYPDDRRPAEAIAVARRYATGAATAAELAAARAAAGAAAWAAARAAALAAGEAAGVWQIDRLLGYLNGEIA